jgi:dihydroorotate dehydrogenase (NAD+) catalytic subunit
MLKTDFLGYTLRSPLMLTEGPISGTEETIRRAAEKDIGLIFTKGIRLQPVKSPVPYMNVHRGSLMNADWSCIGIDEWEKIIARLDISVPLVTSIAKNYVKPQTAVQMAERMVKAGSKLVSFVDYDPVQLIATVRLARAKLKVPIIVKLPPFLPNLAQHLKELKKAGIDAIAAMDSIGPGLSIDIESGEPSLGSIDGSGYVSGKAILPFTLKYIYEISRTVDVPVVGVGGVTDTESAIQMLMAGATGVGMVTAPILQGLEVFSKIEKGIVAYLKKQNMQSVDEVRWKTKKFNAAKTVSNDFSAEILTDICIDCGACRKVCYSNAILYDGSMHHVNEKTCVGCGLCAGVCPVRAVRYN